MVLLFGIDANGKQALGGAISPVRELKGPIGSDLSALDQLQEGS